MRSVDMLWTIALACVALSACKGEEVSGAQLRATASEQDRSRADAIATAAPPTPLTAEYVFSIRCATCHGVHGRGDGPAAQALKPRPRDYSDAAWQKSVTDALIKRAIIEGGAAVGKSSLMAPNADLADKPDVLNDLVAIIRGFAADAAADAPSAKPTQ